MESAGDQHFCLRWNNHQNTLISVFHNLLNSSTLVDCALSAEGRTIQAHKVLLSACSPYFATLLSQHFDKHPIIILKDVKYSELKSMMEYMYRGEVNISQDQLVAFLKAAESLQIKGLTDNSGVNKKLTDAATLSENGHEEEEKSVVTGLQPRKIDDLLAQATKKCGKKYTNPPNMFPTPSRSPLQNMNAITPPMYPGHNQPPPSYPGVNQHIMFGRKDDKVHGGKRRKLNTPVKNFDQVLSPEELLETRMEEGPPGELAEPMFTSGAPSQTLPAETGEDLSSKPKMELFNNNNHHHIVRGPSGNALGNDREVSGERATPPGNSIADAAGDNEVIEVPASGTVAPLKNEDVSSGVSVGDSSEDLAASGGDSQSAAALASAEEVAKRKLNEMNMEKFVEFQEKMRQILKLNNVNFPMNPPGDGSPGPAPLDFSKFDPASPAATAFAFAKLNAAGAKFDTSAAAVAAFNAASALPKGFGSAGGKMAGGGGKLDGSQEEMEEEFEEEEYEGGEGERKWGGGSVANSVHSDDGLERYRDFLANTDLSSLQDNPDLEVTKVRSIKLVCSKSRGKVVKDDSYCNASTSIESLNTIKDSECSNDATLSVSKSQVDDNETEENNSQSERTIADEESNIEDDPASNDDEEPDEPVCSEDIADDTDFEAGNDENANETDAETNPTTAIQKKSTAIKNIFKSTLAKNKPTLKIKLKKQDIIDSESTAQTRSPRHNAGKNFKKCSLGCKEKKIVAKEEPKSKVLSKLKIFNRPKYNNIVEAPKQIFPVPFIKKLKLRNAPPKDTNECTKVKPIKLILKRNTNEEFASSRDPPQSDIESDVENIIQDPPNTSKKATHYAENRILKDISRVEKCSDVDSEDKSENDPLPISPEKMEPFDPHKEFECSDDSDGDEDQPTLLTCAHCDTFGTYNKKDLIRHYKGCDSLCASVICSPVAFKRKKNKCPHCDIYSSSSKTMLRNHLKACKCKPVGKRGRPRKMKVVKEMDTCKFCNFKHPDVNVFLRHLRFCNAAVQQPSSVSSAPAAADPNKEKSTVEVHKCNSCNYVNSNLNIFLYHLKLCNKNYNNLSLKDMLLKYKDKPNIIGYSKLSTSSEHKTCDSNINIPSSSKEMSNSANNICTNASTTFTVQEPHYVPSMFDPIEEEDEYVSSNNEFLNKSVDESKNIAESSKQTVLLQENNYIDPLARFKTLELSESSESEALSYHKNNSEVLGTKSVGLSLVKEDHDQMIPEENKLEFLSNLDVTVSDEKQIHANNPSETYSSTGKEHADNFDEDASEQSLVIENATCLDSASENLYSGTGISIYKDVLAEQNLHETVSTEEVKLTLMPSASNSNIFQTIEHQLIVPEEKNMEDNTLDINMSVIEEYTENFGEECASKQSLEENTRFEVHSKTESPKMKTDPVVIEKSIYNEVSSQVPSTSDNTLFKTSVCQNTSSIEPLLLNEQYPIDNKAKEDLNIPVPHSICIATPSEQNVIEETVCPLETSVQNIPIIIESTTEKSLKPQYATSSTIWVHSSHNAIYKDMELDTEPDAVPIQVLFDKVEETNKSSQEENVKEEILGARRLSFEHFENIASTYYAGQSNSEDENDDDLIRIDPDKEIKHPEINEIDSTTDNTARDNIINTIETKVVLAQSENCLMNEKTDDMERTADENHLLDSEDSTDSKEDVLSLDVSSIHDSLSVSDTKTAPINAIDPSDGTLSQVSSIPKDESFNLDDDNDIDHDDNNDIDQNDNNDIDHDDNNDFDHGHNNDGNSSDDTDDDEDEEEHEFDSQRTCLNCKSFESDDVNLLILHIKECSNVNSEEDSDDDDSDDSNLENETVINIPQNSDSQKNEQLENEVNAEDTIEGGEKNLTDVTCSKKRKISHVEAHPIEEQPVPKFLKRSDQNDVKTKRNINDVEMNVNLSQTEGEHSEISEMDKIENDKNMVDVNERAVESVTSDAAHNVLREDINENVMETQNSEQPTVGAQNNQCKEETRTPVADVIDKETDSVNQEGVEDSELFCSHCNNYSTFEVDELLNHFNQCTAVMNEHGATPYISSEFNELSGKYDRTNCKQIINAKYTNILLGKHTMASPRRGNSSMTPRFSRDLSFSPAESPRYITELRSVARSEYEEDNPDDASNNDL